MTPRIDDELRARFDELREHDLEGQPGFTVVVRRRFVNQTTVVVRNRPLVSFAAAAALVVVATGLWAVKMRNPAERASAAITATIVSWQSPTAGLLETPARHVLAPPALLSSVLDGLAMPTSASSTRTD